MFFSASTSYKKTLGLFFSSKYLFLNSCAGNILGIIKKNTKEFRGDLVTECYQFIFNNEKKLHDKIMLSGMLESIAVNWMNKQIRWNNTQFKRDFLYPQNPKHKVYNQEKGKWENVQCTFSSTDKIQIADETMDDEANHRELMTHQQREYRYAVLFSKMTTEQKCLFDIVYRKGFDNTNTLYNYLKPTGGPSRTQCYLMLKKLRQYIKDNI